PEDHPREAQTAPGPPEPAPQAQPAPGAPRPIEATILTHDGTWTLLADLPGVDRDSVEMSDTGRGGQLVLAAEGRNRRYAGRFDLPEGLGAEDLGISLVNGILELRAKVPSR
ncbi:MAG: hypothetical protein ACOCYW_03845, partial [Roseicyclus sp.]